MWIYLLMGLVTFLVLFLVILAVEGMEKWDKTL